MGGVKIELPEGAKTFQVEEIADNESINIGVVESDCIIKIYAYSRTVLVSGNVASITAYLKINGENAAFGGASSNTSSVGGYSSNIRVLSATQGNNSDHHALILLKRDDVLSIARANDGAPKAAVTFYYYEYNLPGLVIK